jgi:hypothetical protein
LELTNGHPGLCQGVLSLLDQDVSNPCSWFIGPMLYQLWLQHIRHVI